MYYSFFDFFVRRQTGSFFVSLKTPVLIATHNKIYCKFQACISTPFSRIILHEKILVPPSHEIYSKIRYSWHGINLRFVFPQEPDDNPPVTSPPAYLPPQAPAPYHSAGNISGSPAEIPHGSEGYSLIRIFHP